MNTHTLSLKVVFVLASLAACALQPARALASAPSADDAAIRENVKQLETGWNQKSGALFAKPFAEDADYVVINGLHLRGREAIHKGHQHIFDTFMKDTTLALAVEHVRHLRPDVALVHVRARLKTPQADGARATEARITLVMSKEKDGWKIAAFQNTQIASQ